jgi:hypothetical protein
MVKLPKDIIDNIFEIQHGLLACLDSVTGTEFRLIEQHDETADTIPELEEIQNTKEFLTSYYSRLGNLLLKVTESQPIAPNDMLDLLYRSVEVAEAGLAASIANLSEIKRNWSDL